MATANFSIDPADGWVEVAEAPAFIRISAFPQNITYYVYAGPTPPTAADVGIAIEDGCPFWVNVTTTDTYYVRSPNSVPQSRYGDGALRVDVLTVES